MSLVQLQPPRRRAPAVWRLRKARIPDAPRIQELVHQFADRDEMLHRSLAEIVENIRSFWVIEDGDRLVACAALRVAHDAPAEIIALAVAEDRQGHGLGRQIVEACIREAEELGIPSVFALTYKPAFFGRLGFQVVDKSLLPHKVWNECIRCPKFTNCTEIAVYRPVGT
jgi:amino-acid N-acetyltransferase